MRASRPLRHGLMLAIAVVGAHACALDRSGNNDAAAGGNGQGGVGADATGGNGECGKPRDCEGEFNDCRIPTCENGVCGVRDVDGGTPCNFAGGSVCDGEGNCVRVDGLACTDDAQCDSGMCVDGVCCATRCDEFCAACNLSSSEGRCTPQPSGSDPDLECNSGAGVCNGGFGCIDGSVDFANRYGDVGAFQQGWSMAVDVGSNVLVTGHFDGTIDFSGNNPHAASDGTSVFVAKLDLMGNRIWSREFGGAGDQLGYGIAVDNAANVLVIGSFDSVIDINGFVHNGNADDVYLAKLDPNGNRLWSFNWGDGGIDTGFRVATDSMGNVVMFGSFEGDITLTQQHTSAGGPDLFLAKLDATGNLLWSKRFGDAGDETAFDLAVDSNGDIIIVGGFEDTIDFGGTPLTSAGAFDVYIAKLDANGGHLWSDNYGGTQDDGARGVAVDPNDDSIVVTGVFDDVINFGGMMLTPVNGQDAFVAHFDSGGMHLASTSIGGGNVEAGTDVAIDELGNVAVVGRFRNDITLGGMSYSGNGDEGFVVKMTATLSELWSYPCRGAGDDALNAVAVDRFGGVLTFGYFVQDFDVGSGALTSLGGQDVLLARYLP